MMGPGRPLKGLSWLASATDWISTRTAPTVPPALRARRAWALTVEDSASASWRARSWSRRNTLVPFGESRIQDRRESRGSSRRTIPPSSSKVFTMWDTAAESVPSRRAKLITPAPSRDGTSKYTRAKCELCIPTRRAKPAITVCWVRTISSRRWNSSPSWIRAGPPRRTAQLGPRDGRPRRLTVDLYRLPVYTG